ncbi:MAG: lipid IV(A) 3-deoxy-D-manno-octulosonic acid transferase [Oceanospirillaceae bacterium]|nr:lipid IV(A) 3-deoxy-D-manno-octulosonic acid transferase [Oceanospirillaceae bacterium]MCP5336057.1 lipid IV(A) 3-deoxy-D-manno-octulosonic acid transferase [Oceanospirillaceae bacterium]
MARLIYSAVFCLFLPLVLVRMLLRSRKAPAYRQRLWQRFGVVTGPLRRGGVWFHTVSVGEFLATEPLIRSFMQQHPDVPVTVTCTTPTGSEQIQKRLGQLVQHSYLPWDIPLFLYVFLWRFRPRTLVIVETELWPNLVHCSKKMGCKVLVVNARLSEKSAKGYARFAFISKPLLAKIDHLACQGKADAKRFLQLGFDAARLSIAGSIKFDIAPGDDVYAKGKEYRALWGEHRPVWIMASTHAGEDDIALAAQRWLIQKRPDVLLVLVPRHPERFNDVAAQVTANQFSLARRSQMQDVNNKTQVLLVDSMGELMGFYAAADIAVLGGSFVPNGGHNPLEPAALGLPVIMGPSQFNFAQICQQLSEAHALATVDNSTDLGKQLNTWFENENARSDTGRNGADVVKANQGAKQKLLHLIEQHSGL